MRRRAEYRAELAAWAGEHGLRPSRRPACGHGLLGLDGNTANAPAHREVHGELCMSACSADLLGGGSSLWTDAGRPALLVAACFRPGLADPGHEAWAHRLRDYCDKLDLAHFVLFRESFPIYHAEATTVIYGRSETFLYSLFGHSITTLNQRHGAVQRARNVRRRSRW